MLATVYPFMATDAAGESGRLWATLSRAGPEDALLLRELFDIPSSVTRLFRAHISFQDWPRYTHYQGNWVVSHATDSEPLPGGRLATWGYIGGELPLIIWRMRLLLPDDLTADLTWSEGWGRTAIYGVQPSRQRSQDLQPALDALAFLLDFQMSPCPTPTHG